jgi:hypothetical protein
VVPPTIRWWALTWLVDKVRCYRQASAGYRTACAEPQSTARRAANDRLAETCSEQDVAANRSRAGLDYVADENLLVDLH